ncbi:MAG: antitoxin component YwqK of YwqJK toxin-antitoxin module [Saprospiraceae bacterium]|jgi:antitoxin component YwqK of YwqJK toxin-antitoxin module
MKYIFTIILFTVIYTSVFAQYEKVLMTYGNPLEPRWILNCTDDTKSDCTLITYYRMRKPQGEAKVALMKSYYRPIGDAIIYNRDGSVFQKYIYETGTLFTYYPSGELKEKMITPIDGEIERKYKYYKTGQVQQEEEAKREPGRENLSYGHSNNKDKIYDNYGYSYNFLKTFHPNGNLQSFTFYDIDSPISKYESQFYFPDSQLDTASYIMMSRGNRINIGKRYYYHDNGQLREVATYDENGKAIGEQHQWAGNGQLVLKTQFLNGKRHGKLETWWDNGKRKEIGYYYSHYKAGPILRWHSDGRILEQSSYYAGKIVGIATVWDISGGVRSESFGSMEVQNMNYYYEKRYIDDKTVWLKNEGNFKDGMRDGEWTFFYSKRGEKKEPINGLCAKVNYKNGMLEGETFVYFPDGSLCLEVNFKDGMLNGDYISKKEDGSFTAKGHFDNHKKNGLWTTYHHKNNQIYRIEMFENGVHKGNYGEWNSDGFQKQERIDNKEKQQIENYSYYKSGMKLMHVTPYGRKNMDTYEYDTSGHLKKTKILSGDNPKSYIRTEYHPNGNRASVLRLTDGKRDGIYWAWYEDGRMKTEMHFENNKREGESISWNKEGVKTITIFQSGIHIIPNTKEEEAIECSCNRSPKETKITYMPRFLDYVEYKKVKERTPYYTIPEKSYQRLWAKSIQQYEERIWGELVVINDFYVEVDNGLRLNFMACRRGVNRGDLYIEADYDEDRNTAEIIIKDFDLSIEFPKTLLLPYDVENQCLLQTSIEKYQVSSVLFKDVKMRYSDDGKYPEITMEIGETPCFQIAEIAGTGILFDGNNPIVDFSPTAMFPIPSNYLKVIGNQYFSVDEKRHYLWPNQQYLNSFIGVYFPEGKMYLPIADGRLTVEARHILINGKEIYGNMEIVSNEKIALTEVKKYLKEKGFEILNLEIEDNEIVRVFWKYVN